MNAKVKKLSKNIIAFIKWDDLNVSPDAARVTGFDRDYYESVAEDPMVVWKDFEKALYGNNIVLGHNILGYDIYILGVWLRKMGIRISYENFIGELLDTNILAKAIAKGDKNPGNELLAWQMRYLHFRERGLKNKSETSITAL